MSSGPLAGMRPRGMDPATWAAFRRAWNAATSTATREQLCAEYGVSLSLGYRYAKRGAGLQRGFHHNRRSA